VIKVEPGTEAASDAGAGHRWVYNNCQDLADAQHACQDGSSLAETASSYNTPPELVSRGTGLGGAIAGVRQTPVKLEKPEHGLDTGTLADSLVALDQPLSVSGNGRGFLFSRYGQCSESAVQPLHHHEKPQEDKVAQDSIVQIGGESCVEQREESCHLDGIIDAHGTMTYSPQRQRKHGYNMQSPRQPSAHDFSAASGASHAFPRTRAHSPTGSIISVSDFEGTPGPRHQPDCAKEMEASSPSYEQARNDGEGGQAVAGSVAGGQGGPINDTHPEATPSAVAQKLDAKVQGGEKLATMQAPQHSLAQDPELAGNKRNKQLPVTSVATVASRPGNPEIPSAMQRLRQLFGNSIGDATRQSKKLASPVKPRGYAVLATGTLRALCRARRLPSGGDHAELLKRIEGFALVAGAAAPAAPRGGAEAQSAPQTGPTTRSRILASAVVLPPVGQVFTLAAGAFAPRGGAEAQSAPQTGPTTRSRRLASAVALPPAGQAGGNKRQRAGAQIEPANEPRNSLPKLVPAAPDAVMKVLLEAARLARQVADVQQKFRERTKQVETRGSEATAFLDDIVGKRRLIAQPVGA